MMPKISNTKPPMTIAKGILNAVIIFGNTRGYLKVYLPRFVVESGNNFRILQNENPLGRQNIFILPKLPNLKTKHCTVTIQ